MQAIALRPGRAQLMAQLIGLAAMCVAMLIAPPLCLPVSLLVPLFVCPLVGHSRQWWAFALGLAPAALSLVKGGELLFSLSLMLPCLLCVAVTRLQRHDKAKGLRGAYLWYIAAYAASLSVMLVLGARAVGGDLSVGLAGLLTDTVSGSKNSGMTLYRMASAGLIRVPKEYRSANLISFMLDPVLRSELLRSLRLALDTALGSLIPKLFVEVSLTAGLFVYLREQRLNHSFMLVKVQSTVKGTPTALVAPSVGAAGFGALKLPADIRSAMLIVCIGSLVFRYSDGITVGMMGILCESVFQCVFRLMGAAALVRVFSARKPELKRVFGGMAAAAYLLVPTALTFVGVMDQVFHFRAKNTSTDKEEE